MTAEPRMEDLLASIRKAIHEDIGEAQQPAALRSPAAALQASPAPRVGDELAAAASEIQQLREKISRARAGKPLPAAEPAQRSASLAAALQSETPRRNWRELEPAPAAAPRLRGAVLDHDASRTATSRPEAHTTRSSQRQEPQSMLSGNSAQAVQSAFGKLADSVLTRATNDRSVEEITRELLQVMLKQWLDENLPVMVERMVREEIERVARAGR